MMTPTALAADKASGIPLVEMKKIFSDSEFNCRGQFTASDIVELAKDVAARGLVEPIIIRPLWPATEGRIINKGFEYSLVAGFRRYASYKVNEAIYIPAICRDIKTDFEARDINAVENLQRKDLNFWQEAQSIRHYWVASWSREAIAERVSKSPGWCQLRCLLLAMEPEIHNAANQGYILPSDIMELNKYKGSERLQVAGKIRDARKSGEGKGVMQRLKKKDKPSARRLRKAPEIEELAATIRTELKQVDREQTIKLDQLISPQGNMITHRILGWATGSVSSFDVHADLRGFFRRLGHDYTMPDFAEE